MISALEHSAQLFRQTLMSLLSGTGVAGAVDLEVHPTEGTPTMAVLVWSGFVFVPGTQGSVPHAGTRANAGSQNATYSSIPSNFTTQGVYLAWCEENTVVAISEANATNPRIDLICASVQDTQYSGSFNQALLQVVTGTPAASPKPPTPPENTVVLAQVEVKAKVTKIEAANITSKRPGATTGNFLGSYVAAKNFSKAEAEAGVTPSLQADAFVVLGNGGVGAASIEVNGQQVTSIESLNGTVGIYIPAGHVWKCNQAVAASTVVK